MFRYSWSQALFVGEPLEASLERLARLGYDGVELPSLPLPPSEIRARLNDHGLACTSVNGSFIGPGRDLSAADDAQRAVAVDYVRNAMRYAADLGAPVVIVVPTRIGKLRPDGALAKDWDQTLRSLSEIGLTGRDLGVTAVIECVNRAESHLANRLETGRRLVEATGSEHVALMADSFHMNIEETDPLAALQIAAPFLRHVHLADNNRMAPGMGHLDLAGFLGTLAVTGYHGSVTMECDIQVPDRYGRHALSKDPADFDAYAATAMATLQQIEARLLTGLVA